MKLKCQNCNYTTDGDGPKFRLFRIQGLLTSEGKILTSARPVIEPPDLIQCPDCEIAATLDHFKEVM